MQKVVMIGNLCKDVETKTTKSDKFVATFRIAVRRPHSKDITDFYTIVAWEKLGESCAKFLQKGSKVAVSGFIAPRTFEKDNIERTVYEIKAEEVEFLSVLTHRSDEETTLTPIDDASMPF